MLKSSRNQTGLGFSRTGDSLSSTRPQIAEHTSFVGSRGTAEGSGAAGLEEDGDAIASSELALAPAAIAADAGAAASPLPSPPPSPPPPPSADEGVEEAAAVATALSPPRQPPPPAPRAAAPSILAGRERREGGATTRRKKIESDHATLSLRKGKKDEPNEKQRCSPAASARADGRGHRLCRHGGGDGDEGDVSFR